MSLSDMLSEALDVETFSLDGLLFSFAVPGTGAGKERQLSDLSTTIDQSAEYESEVIPCKIVGHVSDEWSAVVDELRTAQIQRRTGAAVTSDAAWMEQPHSIRSQALKLSDLQPGTPMGLVLKAKRPEVATAFANLGLLLKAVAQVPVTMTWWMSVFGFGTWSLSDIFATASTMPRVSPGDEAARQYLVSLGNLLGSPSKLDSYRI